MKTILQASLCLSIALLALSASAANVNPYNYSKWSKTWNDAKLQLGSPSKDVCKKGSSCKSWLNSSKNRKYTFVATGSQDLYFDTNGSKGSKWRVEMRHEGNFKKSSKTTMTAKFRRESGSSQEFTVAQLHKEDSSGPPARIEFYKGQLRVKYRSKSSGNPSYPVYSFGGQSGWKTMAMTLNNGKISVNINGKTSTYKLGSGWASSDYYWKAGIYLQKSGTARARFDYINW